MIKHLFLLTLLLATITCHAQPSADLRIDFIQPEEDQNLQAGEVYLAMINVENHGPDSIRSYDTLWLRVTFSGIPTPDPIYITGQVIPPDSEMPISQQIAFDQSWIGNSCTVCMRIDPLNRATSLSDPDTSNNDDCITVHIVQDVSGTYELQPAEAMLFPVPATDFIQVKTTDQVQRILAIDASGEVTVLDWNGESADCRKLNNGFYLVQIVTEDQTIYQRLMISR